MCAVPGSGVLGFKVFAIDLIINFWIKKHAGYRAHFRKKKVRVLLAEWEGCPELVPCYKTSLGIRDLQCLPSSRGDLALFPRTTKINWWE
jgi:hypothetical protein